VPNYRPRHPKIITKVLNTEKIKYNEDDIPSMNLRRVHFSTILFLILEAFQILEAAAPPQTLQQCTGNLEILKIIIKTLNS